VGILRDRDTVQFAADFVGGNALTSSTRGVFSSNTYRLQEIGSSHAITTRTITCSSASSWGGYGLLSISASSTSDVSLKIYRLNLQSCRNDIRGMYLYYAAITVDVDTVTVSNAGQNYGGATFISLPGAAFTFNDCTFSNNEATNGYGAGLYLVSASSVYMNGCSFTSNTATQQGAGAYITTQSGGNVTITNSDFTGNAAGSAYTGGGLFLSGASTVTLTSVDFENNCASVACDAAAMYVSSPSVFTWNGGNIRSNQATPGNAPAVT
jgi:parallel beta-helix repeat protein